jgi:hypothetical protein
LFSQRRSELSRCAVADRTVWPHLVVITAPCRNDGFGMIERREPLLVEALVAELAVEAFDVRVLRRLARLGKREGDAVRVRPLVERPPGELGTLVGTDRGWIAAESTDRIEGIGDALSIDALGNEDFDRSLVQSSTTVRHLIGRRLASASKTKSIDQVWLGPGGTCNGRRSTAT